jgi:hypothetical protein
MRRAIAAVSGTALAVAGLAAIAAPVAHAANGVPRFDHVIVVMEENRSYNEIIGDTTDAPYINNTLAAGGAAFTNSFAIEHPSEPNYLDLFSGSNQGVTSDACPETFSADNEGAQLLAAGDTFAGYSEGLPSTGSTVCTSGEYARKHLPWTNFTNVPAADSMPWTSFPSSSNYASLPTVSWVIPNLLDDMHDGTIAQGDTWLQNNMNSYATWAKTHNSLLVVTWDEDDSSQSNQIPTIFYGANVQTGQYSNTINHYGVLRTIEDMYGLPYAGAAANATPITNVWSTASNTVAVTNPGNQTGTVGTAANLQISATDSASGQTLTYSATGLPAGLSINSATGVISGTPTAAGTSNVTVSAKDATGAGGSTSFTWTVDPGPDFTVTVSPTSGTVTAGSPASATVSTSAVGGFSGTVGYSATGLPSGAAAGFSPASGAVGSSSTLTLSTSSSTPAGTYAITVTGSSGSLTHSATYSLTVNPVNANTVTVTNPGNQTGTVGTAASLQIAAGDSASGQTLTYSATGLPSGLSIGSSTGLISGTPSTAGTSNATVTATDTTGASGTASFTWTISTSGGGCTAAQLLADSGFENGTNSAPWTATSGVINNDMTSEPSHSGNWDAWLDGYGTTHSDTLAQPVTIPTGCTSANFSFWLHIDTAETGSTAYDKLNVQVLNSSGTVLGTLATFSNVNAATGYVQHSYSLAPYIGQTVTLKFTGSEDSELQTSFVIDDTAVNVG